MTNTAAANNSNINNISFTFIINSVVINSYALHSKSKNEIEFNLNEIKRSLQQRYRISSLINFLKQMK